MTAQAALALSNFIPLNTHKTTPLECASPACALPFLFGYASITSTDGERKSGSRASALQSTAAASEKEQVQGIRIEKGGNSPLFSIGTSTFWSAQALLALCLSCSVMQASRPQTAREKAEAGLPHSKARPLRVRKGRVQQ